MCSVRFHTSCGPVSEPSTATRRARQQLEALATNLPAQGLGGFVPTIEQELWRLD
jgi:hypothetical protein